VVGSVAAHNDAVASGAMFQILLLVSALEAISVPAVKQTVEGSDRAPGEFGFDPLNLSKGKKDKTLEAKEIENGRFYP
jgi:light-harvesting complex I chlorophyll a/b binding protein 1